MKKPFLLIATLFLILNASAQKSEYSYLKNSWWTYYTYMGWYPAQKKEKIAEAGISGYSETITDGKKEFISAKVEYDKNGNTISSLKNNKKNKLRNHYTYQYNSSNKILCVTSLNEKGEEAGKYSYAYDELGNRLEESFSKKGELKAKTVSKFDSTKIQESYYYKNGSPDYKRKWVYSYYPDKSKKSSVIYNSKGKILYTWNYDCQPEGALQPKRKDTTEVCKKEEVDSLGNKTVTVRKFNDKGKAYKTVSVYNKDHKIIQYTSYVNENTLSYSYKYDPISSNMSEVIYYNTKGREIRKYTYQYDINNNLLSTTGYHKGKLNNVSEYTYNSSNLVTCIKLFNRKNENSETYNYTYTYF